MYDDIAYNVENPRPGVIINNPHGEDVYKGVPKVGDVLSLPVDRWLYKSHVSLFPYTVYWGRIMLETL